MQNKLKLYGSVAYLFCRGIGYVFKIKVVMTPYNLSTYILIKDIYHLINKPEITGMDVDKS